MGYIDKYKVLKTLGNGGNGVVHKVENDGNEYALKILTSKDSKSFKRFKDEIYIMKHLAQEGFEGIMPILDDNFDKIDNEGIEPFYSMPIAETMETYCKEHTTEDIISGFISLCDVLIKLHTMGITHRDIKPENILIYNSRFTFADFGLVDYPDKENITKKGDRIGAKNTIAPEMRRDATNAENKRADVYSMAKTLYMLLTKKKYAFEGQYIKESPFSLDKYIDIPINTFRLAGEWCINSMVELENLLIKSTSEDPNERPTIEEFRAILEKWYTSNTDFETWVNIEWDTFLKELFPSNIPEHSEWSKKENILNIFTKYFNKNELCIAFFPDFGWEKMSSIKKFDKEQECLILNNNCVFKPKKLHFEYLDDPKWCYFILELDTLEPLDKDNVCDSGICEHVEDGTETYQRYLKGAFVFTFKKSNLNTIFRGEFDLAYKYHSIVSVDKYKDFISELKKMVYVCENPDDNSISKEDVDESKLLFDLRKYEEAQNLEEN